MDPTPPDYINAVDALKLLGVRPQTLYAYVSRGQIRSVARPGGKTRLYWLEDVQRVAARSAARSGHGAVAASAMNWGEPIISSLITEIRAAGPAYRGHPASALYEAKVGFEAVAELLWTGGLPPAPVRWPVAPGKLSPHVPKPAFGGQSGLASGTLLEVFASIVLSLGLTRGSVESRIQQGQTLVAARQLMQTLVGCCGLAGPRRALAPMRRGDTIATGLMHALCVEPSDENAQAIEAILILMADHELSPGTTSARVVASGGASLHSCVAAALCATSGIEVGRNYDYMEALLGQSRTASVLMKRAGKLLAAGQSVPGFYHQLYPKGDPRALQLLAIARQRRVQTPLSRAVFDFIDRMRREAGLFPRQEIGVVLLSRMMGLQAPAATAIFVMARLAGWVAHVIEQRERGSLLRPRARFGAAR